MLWFTVCCSLSQFPNSWPENVMLVSEYPFPIDNMLISTEALYIMKVHDSHDAKHFSIISAHTILTPLLIYTILPSLLISLVLSLSNSRPFFHSNVVFCGVENIAILIAVLIPLLYWCFIHDFSFFYALDCI